MSACALDTDPRRVRRRRRVGVADWLCLRAAQQCEACCIYMFLSVSAGAWGSFMYGCSHCSPLREPHQRDLGFLHRCCMPFFLRRFGFARVCTIRLTPRGGLYSLMHPLMHILPAFLYVLLSPGVKRCWALHAHACPLSPRCFGSLPLTGREPLVSIGLQFLLSTHSQEEGPQILDHPPPTHLPFRPSRFKRRHLPLLLRASTLIFHGLPALPLPRQMRGAHVTDPG